MIKVRDLSRTECACACGMTFCFQCSREAHAPLLCETLTRWEDKVKDDSATGQWMSANAKRCPKCHMHIEKNGGCNWIACRCGTLNDGGHKRDGKRTTLPPIQCLRLEEGNNPAPLSDQSGRKGDKEQQVPSSGHDRRERGTKCISLSGINGH